MESIGRWASPSQAVGRARCRSTSPTAASESDRDEAYLYRDRAVFAATAALNVRRTLSPVRTDTIIGVWPSLTRKRPVLSPARVTPPFFGNTRVLSQKDTSAPAKTG